MSSHQAEVTILNNHNESLKCTEIQKSINLVLENQGKTTRCLSGFCAESPPPFWNISCCFRLHPANTAITTYRKMEDHIEWGALPPALTSGLNANTDRSQPQPVLIYFIPGNPGLVEYYRAFSVHLCKALQVGEEDIAYHFIGRSLAGFSIHSNIRSDAIHPHPPAEKLPISLEDQVSFVERQIEVLASREQTKHRTRCTQDKPPPMPVILVGHSVGTYIMMQVIERRQSRQKADKDSQPDHEIVGGICLFPTIVDIAKSPSGKKVYVSALC